MKKLFFISALLPIATMSFAGYSVEPIEVTRVLNSLVPIVVPIIMFICMAIAAILITRYIVSAKAKVKQAKYDMFKAFAENGQPIPEELRSDFRSEFRSEVNEDAKTQQSKNGLKRNEFMKVLGILFVIFGMISLLNVDGFRSDMAEFVVGLILTGGGSWFLWTYYSCDKPCDNNYRNNCNNNGSNNNTQSNNQPE